MADDGFISISIDESELIHLGLIMNEIFGTANCLAYIPVRSEPSGGKGKSALRIGHEFLAIYSKGDLSGLQYETKTVDGTALSDAWGEYRRGRELSKWGSESLRDDRPEMWFPLIAPDGSEVYPIRNDGKQGRWRWGKKNPKIIEIIKNPQRAIWEMRSYDAGIIVDGKTERWFPYEKVRETEKAFGWNTWLDKIGFNSIGTKEIKDIFGQKIFDTPKPTTLLSWIINLMSDVDGIILDSFAGSGTTAHVVLKMNQQDGGNRNFILVEMMDYAETITEERVRRVMDGYGDTPGTGGGFDYYELGEPLMLEDGNLNEAVDTDKIREYIWYMETRAAHTPQAEPYLLGALGGAAYYFYYEREGVTTLNTDFLALIGTRAERYIIYADRCALSDDELKRYGITFKKIPRDIAKL